MIITNLYKLILENFNLENLTYGEDVILCTGTAITFVLDTLLLFVIISVLVKLITKKTIIYWINKYLFK